MRSTVAAVIVTAAALLCAPAALADATASSNWAGYAVHRPGTTFRSVQGSWRQPGATCSRGSRTYSSYWVGLGGYSSSSSALEQIGTEVDCTGSGQVRSTAWYELVPAPSVPVTLTVQAGDLMTASVEVAGHRVSLTLDDVTSNRAFTKTTTSPAIDISSAEWIAEAPSACVSAALCLTLPLANFGSAEFDSASVSSSRGHTGGIADGSWDTTKITLRPQASRFFIGNGVGSSIGSANPSALGAGGHSFKVSYSQLPVATPSRSSLRRAPALRAAQLTHLGR